MFDQQLRPDTWCRGGRSMPRAGSHYNLGTSRGPDKIGSRAGPGPRAVSCTWLVYSLTVSLAANCGRLSPEPSCLCTASLLAWLLTVAGCHQNHHVCVQPHCSNSLAANGGRLSPEPSCLCTSSLLAWLLTVAGCHQKFHHVCVQPHR